MKWDTAAKWKNMLVDTVEHEKGETSKVKCMHKTNVTNRFS